MGGSVEAVDNWMAGSMVGLTSVLRVGSAVGKADESRDVSMGWTMAGSMNGSLAEWVGGASESMQSVDVWMAGSIIGSTAA